MIRVDAFGWVLFTVVNVKLMEFAVSHNATMATSYLCFPKGLRHSAYILHVMLCYIESFRSISQTDVSIVSD